MGDPLGPDLTELIVLFVDYDDIEGILFGSPFLSSYSISPF